LPLTGGTINGRLNINRNYDNIKFNNVELNIGATPTNDMVFNIPINSKFELYNSGAISLLRFDSQSNAKKFSVFSQMEVAGTIKTSSALVINSSTYTDVDLNGTSNTAYFASNAIRTLLSIDGGVINGPLRGISNISSASGTISTSLCLNYGFFDINNNTTSFNISNEPGNAGATAFSSFNGGFNNISDNGSNLSLNRMQLVIRGVSKSSSSNVTNTEFNIRVFNTQLGWSNITNFTMKDNGIKKGYTTNISKIFSLPASYSNNEICLGIQKVSSSNDYRCGPVYCNLIN
jgi:hypothetical protein